MSNDDEDINRYMAQILGANTPPPKEPLLISFDCPEADVCVFDADGKMFAMFGKDAWESVKNPSPNPKRAIRRWLHRLRRASEL